MPEALLEMRGISKSFGGNRVLREVDLSLWPREVHAVVGENGAGKLDLDHTVRLNQQPVTWDRLESTLTEVFKRRPDRSMFIRGDATLPYGDVFPLLDIARRSGALDIALLDKSGPATNSAKGEH